MLKMEKSSREFLEKYLPEALNTENRSKIVRALFDLIEEKGYAPPHYDEYNDFGREAQRVYDDVFFSNLTPEELEKYKIKD